VHSFFLERKARVRRHLPSMLKFFHSIGMLALSLLTSGSPSEILPHSPPQVPVLSFPKSSIILPHPLFGALIQRPQIAYGSLPGASPLDFPVPSSPPSVGFLLNLPVFFLAFLHFLQGAHRVSLLSHLFLLKPPEEVLESTSPLSHATSK